MAKILVIDDEKDVRAVLREVLERAGHEVTVAAGGREGLALLERDLPDLVITDVIMPGIDGVATIREMRAAHPEMRVIVISGGGNVGPMEYEPGAIATSAYLASAAQAGADRTLTKPFDRKELLEAVDGLVAA